MKVLLQHASSSPILRHASNRGRYIERGNSVPQPELYGIVICKAIGAC